MEVTIYFLIYFIITSLLGWYANRSEALFCDGGVVPNNEESTVLHPGEVIFFNNGETLHISADMVMLAAKSKKQGSK